LGVWAQVVTSTASAGRYWADGQKTIRNAVVRANQGRLAGESPADAQIAQFGAAVAAQAETAASV
jgi:hypothetical protein